MKIGIIGSGKIGGVVGKLWARAGHEVCFSSRHPEDLRALAQEAGELARVGTVPEAIEFGEVLFVSIPYGVLEEFGRTYAAALRGKIVLETGNPYPQRDGALGQEVRDSPGGTGDYSKLWLPGTRLVRAFNSVWDQTLAAEAHRAGDLLGIPLASDDTEAIETAAALVRDAGFDPVLVGPLSRAKDFDVGSPVYDTDMSGPQLRQALGVA